MLSSSLALTNWYNHAFILTGCKYKMMTTDHCAQRIHFLDWDSLQSQWTSLAAQQGQHRGVLFLRYQVLLLPMVAGWFRWGQARCRGRPGWGVSWCSRVRDSRGRQGPCWTHSRSADLGTMHTYREQNKCLRLHTDVPVCLPLFTGELKPPCLFTIVYICTNTLCLFTIIYRCMSVYHYLQVY